jgi:hypothetical protein
MHDVFVEPSRRYADVVVAGDALSAGVLCGLADRIDKSASRAKSAA